MLHRDSSTEEEYEDLNVPTGFKKFRVIRTTDHNRRVRRSGWFTSIFGIATSDDIVGLFNSEVNLHEREEQVEEHIKNMTVSTNSLVSSIKNVSEDINRLATADADLFKTLEELMKRESTSMSTLQ